LSASARSNVSVAVSSANVAVRAQRLNALPVGRAAILPVG